jgi:hypothetical protein
LTDLSAAAVNPLTSHFVTVESTFNEEEISLPIETAVLYRHAWTVLPFNIIINSFFSRSRNQKIGLSPFPDPGKAVAPEIYSKKEVGRSSEILNGKWTFENFF